MTFFTTIPHHFWLVHHTSTDPDGNIAHQVEQHLLQAGATVVTLAVTGRDCPEFPIQQPTADCVIVIGGDGTVLRSLQALSLVTQQCPIPVLAINAGKLGFLTRVESTQLGESLDQLLAGKTYLTTAACLPSVKDTFTASSPFTRAINDAVLKHKSLPNDHATGLCHPFSYCHLRCRRLNYCHLSVVLPPTPCPPEAPWLLPWYRPPF
ncbi:MAG: NAD(+)/NADH kinase [Vampirovibrionales bacterium]